MFRSKSLHKVDSIELQEGSSLMRSHSVEEAGVAIYARAHRGLYLGRVPVSEPAGPGCTENAVSLLLDKASLDQGCPEVDYVYIDVKPYGLIYYTVDHSCKVVSTKRFNISRISYCSGEHLVNPCIFAWIFHQETPAGFQLECHAVQVKTELRAKYLAQCLQKSFHALYKDVQAALESSKLFHEALTKTQQKVKLKSEGQVKVDHKQAKNILQGQVTDYHRERIRDKLDKGQIMNDIGCKVKDDLQYQIKDKDCDLDRQEVTPSPIPDLLAHPLSC